MAIQGITFNADGYFDMIREKEFPVAVQDKMLSELEKVQNQVEEHLSKPKENDKVVLSKIQKVFPSDREITYGFKLKGASHNGK